MSALRIVFVMSLARSFLSDPHGMIFIHASCDQPLMNSPMTKLKFCVILLLFAVYANAQQERVFIQELSVEPGGDVDYITVAFRHGILNTSRQVLAYIAERAAGQCAIPLW